MSDYTPSFVSSYGYNDDNVNMPGKRAYEYYINLVGANTIYFADIGDVQLINDPSLDIRFINTNVGAADVQLRIRLDGFPPSESAITLKGGKVTVVVFGQGFVNSWVEDSGGGTDYVDATQSAFTINDSNSQSNVIPPALRYDISLDTNDIINFANSSNPGGVVFAQGARETEFNNTSDFPVSLVVTLGSGSATYTIESHTEVRATISAVSFTAITLPRETVKVTFADGATVTRPPAYAYIFDANVAVTSITLAAYNPLYNKATFPEAIATCFVNKTTHDITLDIIRHTGLPAPSITLPASITTWAMADAYSITKIVDGGSQGIPDMPRFDITSVNSQAGNIPPAMFYTVNLTSGSVEFKNTANANEAVFIDGARVIDVQNLEVVETLLNVQLAGGVTTIKLGPRSTTRLAIDNIACTGYVLPKENMIVTNASINMGTVAAPPAKIYTIDSSVTTATLFFDPLVGNSLFRFPEEVLWINESLAAKTIKIRLQDLSHDIITLPPSSMVNTLIGPTDAMVYPSASGPVQDMEFSYTITSANQSNGVPRASKYIIDSSVTTGPILMQSPASAPLADLKSSFVATVVNNSTGMRTLRFTTISGTKDLYIFGIHSTGMTSLIRVGATTAEFANINIPDKAFVALTFS